MSCDKERLGRGGREEGREREGGGEGKTSFTSGEMSVRGKGGGGARYLDAHPLPQPPLAPRPEGRRALGRLPVPRVLCDYVADGHAPAADDL